MWTQLAQDGRATLIGGLSPDYLATLLDTFDRDLTPREIVQSFFKNPSFPLVPSTDEIRRALFGLLEHGWEFVDSDENPLSVASPGQVQINSISQTVRRRRSPAPADTGVESYPTTGGAERATHEDDAPYRSDPGTTPGPESGPVTYRRYRFTLTNRSITAPDAREQVWQLIKELAKVIDPAGDADHQLITLDVTLTTAAGYQGGIEAKAEQAGAQVRVEDEDF